MPTTTTIPDDVRELLTRARANHLGTWTPLRGAIDALRKARGLPPDTTHTGGMFDRFRDLIDSGDVDLDRETRAVARDVLAGRIPPPLTRADAATRIVQRLDGIAGVPAPTSARTRGPKLAASYVGLNVNTFNARRKKSHDAIAQILNRPGSSVRVGNRTEWLQTALDVVRTIVDEENATKKAKSAQAYDDNAEILARIDATKKRTARRG